MDQVFLDANVLFSASYREANSLLRLWQLDDVEILTSAFAANEAATNLSTDVQRMRLNSLLTEVTIVAEPAPGSKTPSGISLPEKDVPILLAANQAHATHLITGDKHHFGPLFGQRIGGTLILPPADYLTSRLG